MTSSMGTGSDTRMYSPRSESDHLYTDGEDYRHGKGSPEEQDKLTDKKIQEKDEQVKTRELPHLKFNIEQSEPDMGMPMPMPPEEPQEDMMEETPMANQAELSDITGSPGTGSPEASISFGAQALSPYGQQTIMAGEPMNIAFQLLKMPFHGTTEGAIEGGRFFGGIKRRGLQPKSPGDGLPKNVFFTDNPVDAASYAKRGAEKHNSRPVMIEFPESDVPTQSSQLPSYAGNYRTTNQTISPTNFQYHYGPQREEGVTDEQYDQQMSQWMFQMNRLQQPQVQQPQMIQQGEPMNIAFQLLKRDGDFSTRQFKAPPGGRSRQKQATNMRAKRQSRTLSPRTEQGGMVNADKAVEMSHLGIDTKQPLRLFPDKYRQSLGTRAMQANRGNISLPYQGHNTERRTPFKPMAIKSELQEMQMLVKSASGYLQLSQLRNILRDLKRAIARKESTKKAPPSGKGTSKEGEAGHRDGETTQPQGRTDNVEADEFRSAGASGHHFVSRGSGRTA
jgi:hypothetical protein